MNRLGKIDQAIHVYNDALVIFENQKNLRGKTFCYTNLGSSYGLSGDHRKALEYYQLALEMDLSSGDRQGEAINRVNIAGELYQLGKREEALQQAEIGYRQLVNLRDPRSEQTHHFLEIWRNEIRPT